MNIDRLIAALAPANVEAIARALCIEAGVDPDAPRSLPLPNLINAPDAPPTAWELGPEWHHHREEAKRLIAVAIGAVEKAEAAQGAGS